MTEVVSKDGSKISYVCDNCSVQTEKYESLFNEGGGNFCGRQCANEFNSKSEEDSWHWKDTTYECEICGSEFEAENTKNANRFCSRECFYTWETRDDLNEVCNICGDEFRRQNHHKGEYCSKECQGRAQRKEGNPNWSGGYKNYYGENWYEQRRKVWRRDQYRCQKCGKSEREIGQKPDAHHIKRFKLFDEPKEANDTENLISLCHECHMQEEYNDE